MNHLLLKIINPGPFGKLVDDPECPQMCRDQLVDQFISLGEPLQGLKAGASMDAELLMAELVSQRSEELLKIACSPKGAKEAQLALWLRNLATLPVDADLRWMTRCLRFPFGLIPRPMGSPLLEVMSDSPEPSYQSLPAVTRRTA